MNLELLGILESSSDVSCLMHQCNGYTSKGRWINAASCEEKRTYLLSLQHVINIGPIGQIHPILFNHALQQSQPIANLQNGFIQTGQKGSCMPATTAVRCPRGIEILMMVIVTVVSPIVSIQVQIGRRIIPILVRWR